MTSLYCLFIPAIVAKERFGEPVPAATSTHAKVELLTWCFLCRPCRVKDLGCSERKVSKWIFPKVLDFSVV